MKRAILLPLLAALCAGCATAISKEGAQVKVFALDPTIQDAAKAMPEGCRLLETTEPYDQEENERLVEDPYAKQRNEVAAKGGNVLLLHSDPILRQPSQDCSPNDRSYGCLEVSQTWYRVHFGYYACAPEAVSLLESQAESAEAKGPIFSWKFAGTSRVAVAQMKSKILEMMHEGVGTDVIVAYVKAEHWKQRLTANDIIDWKKAGIDEKVIQAALGN
jgi:hypothetical protein